MSIPRAGHGRSTARTRVLAVLKTADVCITPSKNHTKVTDEQRVPARWSRLSARRACHAAYVDRLRPKLLCEPASPPGLKVPSWPLDAPGLPANGGNIASHRPAPHDWRQPSVHPRARPPILSRQSVLALTAEPQARRLVPAKAQQRPGRLHRGAGAAVISDSQAAKSN